MSVCKERAWQTLTNLSFERVTGTPAELEAAKYIKSEVDKTGIPCEIESYEIDKPEVIKAFLAVTKPEYKEYPCIGIAKSGETTDEGITAPFAYIENGLDANLTDVKGKIVLASGRLKPGTDEKLLAKGALAYIQIHGDFEDPADLAKELRPRSKFGKEGGLPGIVVHITDAEEIVLSHPEEVKLILKQDAAKKAEGYNVVATIEGTDPELKKEVVCFSAHFDSVPYSPGAWDNATGSITILELMHHYVENKPKRTVKFVWCGSEEIGLVGSRKYCEKHAEELKDFIVNINFDMTGVTLGYEHLTCSANTETLHAIQYLAKLENYPLDAKMGMYSSDSSSFANAGVPAMTFARLQCPGGAQIHNHRDTMAHLDPDSFMITLNFVVKYSQQVINAPMNVIPREFSDDLKKMMEERKKMFASMMGEPKKEEKKEEAKEEKKA